MLQARVVRSPSPEEARRPEGRHDAPRVMKNCEPLVFGPLFAICLLERVEKAASASA
mgnify:CR=1 FL=1